MDRLNKEELKEHLNSMLGDGHVYKYRSFSEQINYSLNEEVTSPDIKTERWPLPTNSVITSEGRNIVGRDPNISSYTLAALMESESEYITEEFRKRLQNSDLQTIAKEEFFTNKDLGATHLAMCIKENPRQTLADLIANYSDDRRLPFVIGAIYITAYMQNYELYYFDFVPSYGYKKKPWTPRRVYIHTKTALPPTKHDFKKYSRVRSSKPLEPVMDCPLCGRPAKLYRAGFRGKDSHVCCTDPTRRCKWFLGTELYSTEKEAIRKWNEMCLAAKGSGE